MIKVYGMATCPGCQAVKPQLVGRENEFEYIDIGSHVRLLKEFLRLRDTREEFEEMRAGGYAGIPCFLWEDGRISFDPEDAGLKNEETVMACSIEDHLAGKEGC